MTFLHISLIINIEYKSTVVDFGLVERPWSTERRGISQCHLVKDDTDANLTEFKPSESAWLFFYGEIEKNEYFFNYKKTDTHLPKFGVL